MRIKIVNQRVVLCHLDEIFLLSQSCFFDHGGDVPDVVALRDGDLAHVDISPHQAIKDLQRVGGMVEQILLPSTAAASNSAAAGMPASYGSPPPPANLWRCAARKNRDVTAQNWARLSPWARAEHRQEILPQ